VSTVLGGEGGRLLFYKGKKKGVWITQKGKEKRGFLKIPCKNVYLPRKIQGASRSPMREKEKRRSGRGKKRGRGKVAQIPKRRTASKGETFVAPEKEERGG